MSFNDFYNDRLLFSPRSSWVNRLLNWCFKSIFFKVSWTSKHVDGIERLLKYFESFPIVFSHEYSISFLPEMFFSCRHILSYGFPRDCVESHRRTLRLCCFTVFIVRLYGPFVMDIELCPTQIVEVKYFRWICLLPPRHHNTATTAAVLSSFPHGGTHTLK